MRIAVVNETSAVDEHTFIMSVLEGRGLDVVNAGNVVPLALDQDYGTGVWLLGPSAAPRAASRDLLGSIAGALVRQAYDLWSSPLLHGAA